MARVTEVTRTTEDDDVAAAPGPDGVTVFQRIVYILGGVLLVLLGMRVLLSLLGANRENGFADMIYGITYPFVQPFFGLFGYEVEYGVSRLEIETIVAIIVYAAIIALIVRLAGVGRPRRV